MGSTCDRFLPIFLHCSNRGKLLIRSVFHGVKSFSRLTVNCPARVCLQWFQDRFMIDSHVGTSSGAKERKEASRLPS